MAEKLQSLLWDLLNHLPNDSQAAVEDPEGMGIHCLPGFPFCFWICPIWIFYQWSEATLPITLHSCWHHNLIPSDRDRSLSIWNVKMKHCKQPMSYILQDKDYYYLPPFFLHGPFTSLTFYVLKMIPILECIIVTYYLRCLCISTTVGLKCP